MSSTPISDISHGIEAYPIVNGNSISLENLFQYVKTNVPGPGFNRNKFSEQFAGCDCDGICTINSCSCLQIFGCAYENGKLKTDVLKEIPSKPVLECGHACSCNPEWCSNRIVQQGIKKTLQVFRTEDKGYGLRLDSKNKSGISRLSFVCEYAGEVIGQETARQRMKQTDHTGQINYLIALKEHVSDAKTYIYIDPTYIGNVGRFINHSCDPNLFMVPVRVNHQVPRLALFARKNIKPGEELTFDYSGNATLDVPLDLIAKVVPVNSHSCSFHSETPNSSGNIYFSGSLMDKLVQNVHSYEVEADLNSSRKRMKVSNTGCSPDFNTYIHNGEDHGNKKDIEVTRNLKKSVSDNVVDKIPSHFGADNPKASTASFIRRKPCFCGSHNCTGVLPVDSQLLYD